MQINMQITLSSAEVSQAVAIYVSSQTGNEISSDDVDLTEDGAVIVTGDKSQKDTASTGSKTRRKPGRKKTPEPKAESIPEAEPLPKAEAEPDTNNNEEDEADVTLHDNSEESQEEAPEEVPQDTSEEPSEEAPAPKKPAKGSIFSFQ